jgi:glucosamine--fructose-6-phosphate aminotransferase (isomerizing)
MDSLKAQAEMALTFIGQSWPRARDAAAAILDPLEAEIEKVILCGCGDSHHAAVGVEMAFAEWTGRRVRAAPAMLAGRYLVSRAHVSQRGELLIGISVSGEVARTLEAVESAAARGMRTLALTANADSSLSRAADAYLTLPLPEVPHGPGLLNFLSSLLMGYGAARALASPAKQDEIDSCFEALPDGLADWIETETLAGRAFAQEVEGREPVVFLGSGPAYAMAIFAAAKLVEAAGVVAWGQDVEEWAHVEYFCDPPGTATWLLSSGGRSKGREGEVAEAARAIRRTWRVSRWSGHPGWSASMRETLSPLALWPGPAVFAGAKAAQLGEEPFRGFGGGRSTEEGGGASRIRSSARLSYPDAPAD